MSTPKFIIVTNAESEHFLDFLALDDSGAYYNEPGNELIHNLTPSDYKAITEVDYTNALTAMYDADANTLEEISTRLAYGPKRVIPEQQIKEVSHRLYDAVIRRVNQCNDCDPVIVELSVSYDQKACIENSLPIATVRLYSEDLGWGWTIFQLNRAIAVLDDIAINVDTIQQVDITSHDIERMQAMPKLVNIDSPHF